MIRIKPGFFILTLSVTMCLFFLCISPEKPDFSGSEIVYGLFADSACTDTINENSTFYYMDTLVLTVKLQTPHRVTDMMLVYEDSDGNILYADTSSDIAYTDSVISLKPCVLSSFGDQSLSLTFVRPDTVIEYVYNVEVEGVPPLLGNDKKIDTLGQNVVDSLFCFYISVTGTGPLTFTWYKDDTEFKPGKYDDTLYFSSLALSDRGMYKCIVESEWGSDSTEPYNLNLIHSAPAILNGKVIQASAIPQEDSALFLYVEATGSEPLQYKWSHNGLMIVGAINDTLHISDSLSLPDTGAYVCSLSNLWGEDVSVPYTIAFGNHPPQWKSDTIKGTVREGNVFNLSLIDSCTDPDNDILTFSLIQSKPSNDTITERGLYSYRPALNDAGHYYVIILAGDGKVYSPCVLSLTVTNDNQRPEFRDSLPAPFYKIDAGAELNISFIADDPDTDRITYSMAETTLPRPDSIVFTDSTLSWQSNADDGGSYTIEIHATDGYDTAVAQIDVAVGDIKLPPNISIGAYQSGDTIRIVEMQTLVCTVTVTDPDPGELPTLEIPLNKPDSAHFETTTGLFTYRPNFLVSSADTNFTYGNVTFIATDNASPPLKDTFIVHLEVVDSNTAPVLEPIEDVKVEEGDTISFTVSATDINGDSLYLYALSMPDGSVFTDSGNGKGSFEWQTTYTDADTYNVAFVVDDDVLFECQYVTIIVTDICIVIRTASKGGYISNIGPGMLPHDTNYVKYGTQYTLAAKTSSSIYKFSNWSGDVPDDSAVNPTIKGIVTSDLNLKAEFVPGEMVLIPAKDSSFQMGKPGGVQDTMEHNVTFTYDFWMDPKEVIQADYVELMGVNPSHFSSGKITPVENLTWFDAVLYCNAKSKADTLDTVYVYAGIPVNPGNGCTNLDSLVIRYECSGYRLPTEAEWEYAYRGGTTTQYFWGDSADSAEASKYAWHAQNSGSVTQEVGTKDTNNYGLYDMAGNVWEFINDYYAGYTGNETNPTGPEFGDLLYRGGSFEDSHEKMRCYWRYSNFTLDYRNKNIGFRVARPRVNPF